MMDAAAKAATEKMGAEWIAPEPEAVFAGDDFEWYEQGRKEGEPEVTAEIPADACKRSCCRE